MKIIEFLELALLLCLCVYFSVTDLRYNRISNKVVFPAFFIAAILDAIYYGRFERTYFQTFLINILLVAAVAVLLYWMHIWAAGDSKLLILVSLLIPAARMVPKNGFLYELMIPVYSFAAGFIFLIGDSIRCLTKGNIEISKSDFIGKLKDYSVQYIINSIYMLTLVKAEDFVLGKFGLQLGIYQALFNICILILICHFQFFRRRDVIALTAMASVLYSVGTEIWMFNQVRIYYYLLTLAFMILQIIIGEFNYKTIPTENVKTGMVMSFGTTVIFARSRVKGLPGMSTEDMKSRITREEAEAIHRWKNSKYGKDSVTIVRKIPFAIFISIGAFLYIILGSLS